MNLKYLSFSHITGFDDLTNEQKDEFILLYKKYVLNTSPNLRGELIETNMTSVCITSQYNYRASFLNRPDILLKTDKKKAIKPKKISQPTTQVRIYTDTHEKIKNLAKEEKKEMVELFDEACSLYLKSKGEEG